MEIDVTLRGAIEALLFVSDEPVSVARVSKILERDQDVVSQMLEMIAEEYRGQERGFQLREVAGGWRLYTHPAHHDAIEQYVLSWDTRRLSQAALEALAVIAYHQPVTRAGINAVRGVNSEAVLSSLIEKGLVKEAGRDRDAGNAILYTTTRTFLEKFGLKSLDELPPLEEFAPDERTEAAIKERFGGPAVAVTEEPDDDSSDLAEID
ncbi:MAG: SMC-Scp complex subunit ScpB [Coriobacteriia bacterium]|jgi:segregation and condensation protein B|nr:SMC-Scp complex subunit ScpB [Coriobacteriia bacterium]